MNITEAESIIYHRIKCRIMAIHAIEAFRDLAPGITTVSRLRVPTDWPARSITFTRDADGKRVRIWRDGNTFRGKATQPRKRA